MNVAIEFLLGPQDGREYDSRSCVAFDRQYANMIWNLTKHGTIGECIIGINPDLSGMLLAAAVGSELARNLHRHEYVVVDKFTDGMSTHVVLLYSRASLQQDAVS